MKRILLVLLAGLGIQPPLYCESKTPSFTIGQVADLRQNFRGRFQLIQLIPGYAIYGENYYTNNWMFAIERVEGAGYVKGQALGRVYQCASYLGVKKFTTADGFDQDLEVWRPVQCSGQAPSRSANPAGKVVPGHVPTEWDGQVTQKRLGYIGWLELESEVSSKMRKEGHERGDWLRVLTELTRMQLQKFPDNGDAWYNLGKMLSAPARVEGLPPAEVKKIKTLDEAIQAYQKADALGCDAHTRSQGMYEPKAMIAEVMAYKSRGCLRCRSQADSRAWQKINEMLPKIE